MNFFDSKAKNWDADPMKVERARSVAESIRRIIPLTRNMSALEYGCGTGLLSFALQPYLGDITLADTSSGMLAALAEKIQASGADNMRGLRLDLSVDEIPAQRFHLTYSLMTLHHIPDTAGILKKFYALLKPGGYLLIADLDAEDGSFHVEGEREVHHGFARAALQAKVEAAGFTDARFSAAFAIHKMIGEVQKDFPVFLMAAQKRQ